MKKTVILIHGYLTNYHDFGSLPKELIKYYDNVVLLQIPGHGRYRTTKEFTVDATISTVEKEVEFYLDKGTVDLIGFSMGGALTRYLCVKYQKINKAVMLAPATYYLSPLFAVERLKYIFNVHNNEEKVELINKLKQNDKIAKNVVLSGTIKRFTLSNGLTFCKLITKINDRKGHNPTPSLIIWGRLDELVPKTSADFCYKNCCHEDSELVIIDGLGHLMLRSNYEEELKKKIIEFLNK